MPKPIMNERTINDYMKRNKCSREDAIELIKYDCDVEDGKDTEYDLTPEQEQVVQDLRRKVEHKKPNAVKRERKPNELKEALVLALADFLENECEFDLNGEITYCGEVEITNKNRMIHFSSKDKEFDLQLIEKRVKKS